MVPWWLILWLVILTLAIIYLLKKIKEVIEWLNALHAGLIPLLDRCCKPGSTDPDWPPPQPPKFP